MYIDFSDIVFVDYFPAEWLQLYLCFENLDLKQNNHNNEEIEKYLNKKITYFSLFL